MQLKMLDQSVQVARLAASEPRGHQLDPDPLCQRSEAKEPHLKNPIFVCFHWDHCFVAVTRGR
jgi:hypothetical protein